MRYIAILLAMVAVLVLSLLGLQAGGSSGAGPTAVVGATSPAAAAAPAQDSQAGYSTAIGAAKNAVSEANRDAQSAASANP
ncbi:MAG: hypothetical protein ABSC56_08500 [Solirubrobacteraceae bacterium]|jgi:hypothetical protein